ncbi:PREDICTED: UDP-GlcNAc:betaGal beta-1,3-N-acetylglucosaminyltransferase 9 [Chinchilla lanigera]|uniref:UDP-GlcNAc:betaGal beta-1,3-N-acetylglucosaminyltransferase 9 n=1 Tax=Chinchilla lanigera TaxID=34839 RepID=UPI00038F0310|nr:PREDICTED: UDP-GlcNAc:betaGal beta-1,3-N-acetylglucosaminyltransferase 9 [Chinchilla lanigera]
MRRLRLRGDALLTLLLGTALALLLYAQHDGPAPISRAPREHGRGARRTTLRPRIFQVPAGTAPPAYEEDTPAPPTPPGPFDFRSYLHAKDLRRFPLLINQPHKCRGDGAPGGRPDLLIAVKSVAADFERRQAVRQTWGSEGRVQGALVRRVFLLGVPRAAGTEGADAKGADMQGHWRALLHAESRAYADILLWAFDDTFFNLTLKEIHFLAWASAFCPDVHFVFKGDADVFVHVGNLLEFLAPRDPAQDLLAGDVIVQARPIRARGSKYYIPEAVYGLPAYPAYAGGGGFVLSGATLRRLSSACKQVELFPIDDVFLGMCLQRLRLTPEPHPAFRTFGISQPSAAPHLHTFDPCFYRELVVVHGLSASDIWLMWRLLHGPYGPVCAHPQPVAAGPFQWGS